MCQTDLPTFPYAYKIIFNYYWQQNRGFSVEDYTLKNICFQNSIQQIIAFPYTALKGFLR